MNTRSLSTHLQWWTVCPCITWEYLFAEPGNIYLQRRVGSCQQKVLNEASHACSLHCVQMDSQDVALQRGRQELSQMIDHFVIRPREETLDAAHRLYRLALCQAFTRGRVVKQVAAACLYIICRIEGKPFMLLDYSDLLQVGLGVLVVCCVLPGLVLVVCCVLHGLVLVVCCVLHGLVLVVCCVLHGLVLVVCSYCMGWCLWCAVYCRGLETVKALDVKGTALHV
jgi:hypothetical protein